MSSTTISVAPTVEPVSLEDMKIHLRVDGEDEDGLIASWIKAARQLTETATKRQLVTATWKLYLPAFPSGDGTIYLPYPPLDAVAQNGIAYVDTDGADQTVASTVYTEDAQSCPGRITLAYAQTWPSTRSVVNAVTITYDCGYGAPSAVPEGLKAAMRLLVGHWYEWREAVTDVKLLAVPMAVKSLWMQYWTGELY